VGGGSNEVSDRPEIEIQRQTAFGDDGQLEVTKTSVETSLEDFGADVDHRDRDSRLDRPEASKFGVDDRHLQFLGPLLLDSPETSCRGVWTR